MCPPGTANWSPAEWLRYLIYTDEGIARTLNDSRERYEQQLDALDYAGRDQ